MKAREIKRKAQKQSKENKGQLTYHIAKFLEDCNGQTPEKIKEIYQKYEALWVNFSQRMNNTTRYVTVFEDAFEASIMNAHAIVKEKGKYPPEEVAEYLRIFEVVRRKSTFEKVFMWFKAHFFIREKKAVNIPAPKVSPI